MKRLLLFLIPLALWGSTALADSGGFMTSGQGAGGGVTSAVASDMAILRADGTGGNIEGSGWAISDTDVMTAGGVLDMAGNAISDNTDSILNLVETVVEITGDLDFDTVDVTAGIAWDLASDDTDDAVMSELGS